MFHIQIIAGHRRHACDSYAVLGSFCLICFLSIMTYSLCHISCLLRGSVYHAPIINGSMESDPCDTVSQNNPALSGFVPIGCFVMVMRILTNAGVFRPLSLPAFSNFQLFAIRYNLHLLVGLVIVFFPQLVCSFMKTEILLFISCSPLPHRTVNDQHLGNIWFQTRIWWQREF